MMKLNKKVLNSSLVVLLALGLGGCAANSATTTHKSSHEAASAQVVKQNSHKKAAPKAAKSVKTASESTAANSSVANNSSSAQQSSATASSSASVAAKGANAASASSVNSNAVTSAKAASRQSSSSAKQTEKVQLGLGDIATWTDSKGTTHHVDSDGMDRYTTKGSSQVQYQDWSGELPSNAVVSHQN